MDFINYTNAKGTKRQQKLYVGTERGVILTIDISELLELQTTYDDDYEDKYGSGYDNYQVDEFRGESPGQIKSIKSKGGPKVSNEMQRILDEHEKIIAK